IVGIRRAGNEVTEVTSAGAVQQHSAVGIKVLFRVGVFVEEVEEEFILLRQYWTTFTRSRQRKRTADVKTVLMLKQDRLGQAADVVEERVGVKFVIAIIVVCLAMIT